MADNKRLRIILEGINKLSPTLSRAKKDLQNFQKEVDKVNASIRKNAGTSQFAQGFKEAQQNAKAFDKQLREAFIQEQNAHRQRIRNLDEEARKQKQSLDYAQKQAIKYQKQLFTETNGLRERSTENAIKNLFLERDARLKAVREARGGINPRGATTNIPSLASESGSFVSKADAERAIHEETRASLAAIQKIETSGKASRSRLHDQTMKNIDDEFTKANRLQAKRLDESRSVLRGQTPTEASVLKGVLEDRSNSIRDVENSFKRAGLRAGTFFSDVKRGFSSTGEFGRKMSRDVLKAESAFFRFGRRVGSVINDINRLINLRWALLVGFLQVIGTLLSQVAAALVLIGSSAITAAVALGGALVAALGQAAVAFGVLYAAIIRVQKVFSLVQLAQKQQLRDSRDAEAQADAQSAAQDRLTDAMESLRDAHLRLSKARKQAARDIVDAALDERDAELSLKEAELGVLEAKERLRKEQEKSKTDKSDVDNARAQVKEAQQRLALAQQQGDNAEITKASHQLSTAKSNLDSILDQVDTSKTDLKDAQLGVERSRLTLEKARITKKRSDIDNPEIIRKGVGGADEVVDAQKNLTKATRELTRAKENLVKASNKETAAQANLKEQLADLSPAERRLFNATNNFVNKFKKQFRPVTDIIIDSFARAITKVSVLLDDPKIIVAATKIAKAIAGSVDQLANFVISPEFKKALETFAEGAARNIPKLTTAFINLVKALIRIGIVATPIFNRLVDSFAGLTEKAEKFTRNEDRLKKVFAIAGEQLDKWLRLGKAIARIVFLITVGAQGQGGTLLDHINEQLERAGDFLEKNPDAVKNFFKTARENLEAFSTLIFGVAKILFGLFTSKESEAFTKLLLETTIPAFAAFVKVAGTLSRLLVGLFGLPVIGPAAKFTAQLLLTYGIFKRLFPFLPKLRTLFSFGDDIIKSTKAVTQFTKAFIALAKAEGVIGALSAAFPKLAKAVLLVRKAMVLLLFTPPYIVLIIAAIIAAIVLLDRKFHFLAPTIRFLKRLFIEVFNWVKEHWKLLAAIIIAPIALAVLAIVKYKGKIVDAFKFVINWFRNNWKTVLKALIFGPFYAAYLLIKKLFQVDLINVIKKLPELIKKALKGLPGVVKGILEKIPGFKAAEKALGAAKGLKGKIAGIFDKGGKIPGGTGEAVPIIAHAGEWILNKSQQHKIANRLGATVGQAQAYIFGTNIGTNKPGGKNQKITSFAGGTYNLVSQEDPDSTDAQGNPVRVNFIQMADGTFGQVTARDAKRITASRGKYIPSYVRRNSHGFSQRMQKAIEFRRNFGGSSFAMGGVVPQSFANGGVVMNQGGSSLNSKVTQHFNVTTKGETDWSYVMRLSAITAQSSF